MELIEYILKLSIGGVTIGLIVVYLGKLILNKSSEILLENHKSKLELTRIEHQIRFSSLHSERGEIIKLIYQDLYELEQKLVTMTSLFQGREWAEDKTRDEAAINKYHETFNRLEQNRIYFSEDLCNQISSALDYYKQIIEQMLKAKNKSKYERDGSGFRFPEGQGSLEMWIDAEKKAETEIRKLRLNLAEQFRDLIGV
ncbi:hypothetical protein PP178_00745 [Zeaxanthinibacter sp. PT1]|uniref:hypothetical protein n=1 Tax=Zeaxanthinibacter TaxID=561554 RepID=UPI00234B7598|nr:hypothetical protein [Zeaxanthinibacter sp. PT1]MDC6350064.1 hypothetical protein [Zeaxanthinibacter sp. PT1]